MNQINPRSLKLVKGLPPVAQKGDKISWDTEFFGQTKSKLHRPHGQFAYLGCTFDGVTVYYVTETEQIQEFLDRLDAGVWILHNAKYDITQLRRFIKIPQRKRIWDCFLIEQIMWSGFYDSFSLKDLVRRRLNIYMPKGVRDEFSEQPDLPSESQKLTRRNGANMSESVDDMGNLPQGFLEANVNVRTMSREQLEYACIDVSATWQVYQSQRAEIDENDLNIWKDIERPSLWTIMAMSGVKIDTESWIRLAKKNEAIAKGIQDKYGHWEVGTKGKKNLPTEVFVGINLNSPAQVKKHFADGGLKLKSTDAAALEKIIADGDDDSFEFRFASDLLTYRTYAKRSSTYGEKFIENYVEEDGRIYGDIFQMGAQTGRTSSRSPNLQNQPHETEYRSCFISDKGNVIIVADWGSQEPRVAAFLSQDERLIEILNSDKKLYIEIARDVFGREISKQDEEYTHIKSTVLGIFYGMGAMGLSKRIGVSEDDAQDMINKILETYPGIQDYIERQKKAGEYVQSIYGRKIWLNKYNNGWLRDALNYPIQSSAADAMKIAAYRFVDAWKEYGDYHNQFPLRLLVHDEIVCEVEEESADAMKRILKECMIDVAEEMHQGIKGSVEIFSGVNWGCKK